MDLDLLLLEVRGLGIGIELLMLGLLEEFIPTFVAHVGLLVHSIIAYLCGGFFAIFLNTLSFASIPTTEN
jgi:hypothetical protein